jgi:hypothetical protein
MTAASRDARKLDSSAPGAFLLAQVVDTAVHGTGVCPVPYPTRAHRAVAGRNDQAFDAPPDGDPLPPRRLALTLKQDRGSDSGLQA